MPWLRKSAKVNLQNMQRVGKLEPRKATWAEFVSSQLLATTHLRNPRGEVSAQKLDSRAALRAKVACLCMWVVLKIMGPFWL